MIYKNEWNYLVTVKWYHNWEIVGVSSMIVWVWDKSFSCNLVASNLSPNIWEELQIFTNLSNLKKADISKISRDFWDWTSKVNNDLIINYTYSKEWEHVITQNISLKNGTTFNNYITIYAKNPNIINSYTIESEPTKLVSDINEEITFSTKKYWSFPNILLTLYKYGDSITKKDYDNLNYWQKLNTYKYDNKWIFFPQISVYVDECIDLDTISTVAIYSEDKCLKALWDWTLSKYRCDMDSDWIPDICDDDIDWDWIKNLIGIISHENNDCSINADNINQDILSMQKNVCSLDICPINSGNQIDINNNGIWDTCDYLINTQIQNNWYGNGWKNANLTIDSDWDWINDNLDKCPNIPENYNWIKDYDWCPEIWNGKICSVNNFNYYDYSFRWWLWDNIWDNNISWWDWGSIGGNSGSWWGWGSGSWWDWGSGSWWDWGSGSWWGWGSGSWWDWGSGSWWDWGGGDWNDNWEIPIDINNIDTPIVVSECLSCPCNYADFASNLNIGDQIQAILRDYNLDTIFSQTTPISLKLFMN